MFSPEQYQALRHASGLVPRSDLGRLQLTGEDRRAYLQGLLTNDINALSPGTGCYAAFLTAQGRMISDMVVLETGDQVLMPLPLSIASAVCDRLEQFIFSEDVHVADVTSALAQFGVYGPSAAETVCRAMAAGASPDESSPTRERLLAMQVFDNGRWDFAGRPVGIATSDEFGIPGFELFVEAGQAGALSDALRGAGAVDVSVETAEVCRVEAGRPRFHVDMDEETIPLEAGIEDRAISLTKGCYVGQEIIIRVLHRGHGRVARRLVQVALEAGAQVPSRGDTVRAGERDIGSITSAVFSPALGRPLALAYVHRDFVAPSTEVVVMHDNQELNAVVYKP